MPQSALVATVCAAIHSITSATLAINAATLDIISADAGPSNFKQPAGLAKHPSAIGVSE